MTALDPGKLEGYGQETRDIDKKLQQIQYVRSGQKDQSNPYFQQYTQQLGLNKDVGWLDREQQNLENRKAALGSASQGEETRLKTLQPFAELQQKQQMRADQFKTAFPSILDSKLATARTDARRNIAEGVSSARSGYNSRGLLYSGLRAGAEGDVAKNEENKLADTATQTNQQLLDTQNQLNQDVADTGIAMGNVSQNIAGTNEDYRQSLIDSLLQKDTSRQQAIGGLLGAGAQVAGVGLGAALKPAAKTT